MMYTVFYERRLVNSVLKLATGKSHAKIILLGEHAVVYNEPAIALPLPDLKMVATITPRSFGQIILAGNYQGSLNEMTEAFEGIRQLINRLLRFFSNPKLAFTLKLESNIPLERGMGSSAATAVAIIRAFFALFETELSDRDLQRWANVEEAITHGSPSGIDAATAAHDVPVWFVKGQKPMPISMSLDATLIIADTGVHGQTGLAVSVVREQLLNEPVETQDHLSELGKLSVQAQEFLAANSIEKLGPIMNSAQQHLSALGVSHPYLDALVDAALEAGALGAKLTGGGVGGTMLALASNDANIDAIASALEAAGAREIWVQKYYANKE